MRDKVLGFITYALLLLSCFIGIRDDWPYFILVIPFGWLLLGIVLDMLINGKRSKRKSTENAIFCALILTSVTAILFRQCDTVFIIGRLICCIGCTIAIIRTTHECENDNYNKNRDEIENLKSENKMLNEEIETLLKH